MTPERWQQIRDLLDSAIPLAPAEWSAFLDQHCASDPALRQEVERLLDTEGNVPPSFLESPVLEQLPEQQEACMRFVGTPLFGNIVSGAYTPLLAKDSETDGPEVGLQEFRQIGARERPRVYECYWAHFATEIHLSV